MWAALSLVAVWLGWISDEYLVDSLFGLFGASVGACSAFMATLSRRSVSDNSAATIAILLGCAGAVAAFIWGPLVLPHARLWSVVLLALPLFMSSFCFWSRPLQFPAQRISKG